MGNKNKIEIEETPNPNKKGDLTVEDFKRILEYFVKHMQWLTDNKNEKNDDSEETSIKIPDFIDQKSLVDGKFFKSGHGYKQDKIQEQMEKQSKTENKVLPILDKEQKICISVYTASGFRKGSYLHLKSVDNNEKKITNETAGTNINPVFNETKEGNGKTTYELVALEVGPSKNEPTYVFPSLVYTFEELGLHLKDGESSTVTQEQNLQTFFNYFSEMRKQELIGALTYKGYDQLLATHNMILTGAPGTGKTWSAKNIASWIIKGESYLNLSETEKKDLKKYCELVQFHPSYDYTDFVEGLRPISKENSSDSGQSNDIGFELKGGVFKKFCEKALIFYEVWKYNQQTSHSVKADDIINQLNKTQLDETQPDKTQPDETQPDETQPAKKVEETITWEKIVEKNKTQEKQERDEKFPYFIFIIDEINRGELSKIFGELFFSIDPGYRGTNGAVLTQYANMVTKPNTFDKKLGSDDKNYGHFFVPKNVYIIGTMNDIDRSVESMDFAMRRRFSFLEVKANERMDMWSEDWKDLAASCMKAINEKIEKIAGLSSAYHIGPAYFKKLTDYESDFFKLWDNHLYGVLFEYLRGKKDANTTINNIQDEYLKALVGAIQKRFNYGGKWGESLISKWQFANQIDSSISIDPDNEKASTKNIQDYLEGLQNKISYTVSDSKNNRANEIFKLRINIEHLMGIGGKIEKLEENK